MGLVSMELADDHKVDSTISYADAAGVPKKETPDYPYGLRISLTEKELEKLRLDCSDCATGDLVYFRACARVISKSQTEHEELGKQERVELQIEDMEIDDGEESGE